MLYYMLYEYIYIYYKLNLLHININISKIQMLDLCQYKDIFGKPGEGVHK